MIVLAFGPYSGISAGQLGLSQEEWLSLSGTIRLYHECTHFICRRLYPDNKEAVWDELVADAVGIYVAFGKYDSEMAALFLGICGGRYKTGRLENYVCEGSGEDRQNKLEELSERILPVLQRFGCLIEEKVGAEPFDIAILLEEKMGELWSRE